jgi:ligand-binding sensor domain-containing protein
MYRTLLFVFCLLSYHILKAQTPFAKELWLNDANIPVAVNDLVYDSLGYLWLGTEKGLYKYNGREFRQLTDSIQQPVSALANLEGSLYIGYRNGKIGVVKNGAVSQVTIRNKFPSSTITSLQSRGHFLWITTESEGVFVVVNGAGIQLNTESGLTDDFLYSALIASDEVMVTTDRGINHIRWDDGKPRIEVFTTAQGLPDNIVRVLKPIRGTRQCWLGTQEGGLALYDDANETFHRFRMSHPWAWGQVNDILSLSVNDAFVATEDGYLLKVTKFEDSLEVIPYTYEGLKLKKLARDRTGNIWCATNKGLLMNTALYAADIRLQRPFDLRNVTALVCDKKNNLWFTQNRDLFRLSLSNPAQPIKVLTAPAAITCLFADKVDGLWIGTFGKGLFSFRDNQMVPIRNIPELQDGHILSAAVAKNRLWISSLNGVEETIADQPSSGKLRWVRHHNKLSGTGSDYIYQLYADHQERMWLATDGGGVCMYDGMGYRRWDTSSGLTSLVVYSITEDAFANIWAGTLEKGLFRYQRGKWQQIKEMHGLQGTNITSLRGNASGQVIIVNEEGIDQWYPSSGQFRHYNRRSGIDIDSTSTVLNCITNDTAGNVYVPFEHGFIVFKSLEHIYDIAPLVEINAISLFFKPLIGEQKDFKHDQNHISFRYDGINFSNPDRVHYRYMLEGYDNNWIYTNDEEIPFAQLPPGDYVFRVQASLNNLFDGAREDNYSFSIEKPFWQRAWFIVLASLSVAGAGMTFIRIRESGIRNMSRIQRERMVFEYEHLKSQVNPHFLFNSLNTLVNLIEDDQKTAVDYTVHLSDLYRNMLSYRDQDLILLSEEYEIITNYMYIQKSRFGEAINLHTEIPEELLKTKKIVPLALQLLVENAIKHNVVSLARPLTISIVADETQITVTNPLQPKLSKEKGAGLGLINIKNRYGLLTSKKPHFGISNNEYIVILPLL